MSEPAAPSQTLRRHTDAVAIARLPPGAPTPAWIESPVPLTNVVRTPTEVSVTAAADAVPAEIPTLGPYTAFAVDGVLDPGLVGVLSELLEPLAATGVSVMTCSTYDTDWILVPAQQADAAAGAWRRRGHRVV